MVPKLLALVSSVLSWRWYPATVTLLYINHFDLGPIKVRTTLFPHFHSATLAPLEPRFRCWQQTFATRVPPHEDSKNSRYGLQCRNFSTQSQRWSFSPAQQILLSPPGRGRSFQFQGGINKLQHDKDQNNLTCGANVEFGSKDTKARRAMSTFVPSDEGEREGGAAECWGCSAAMGSDSLEIRPTLGTDPGFW